MNESNPNPNNIAGNGFAGRQGWESWLAKLSMAALLFEAVTGLAITFGPFHAVQWSVLAHTVVGALTLLPLAWYCTAHWWEYRHWALSHIVLLGYVSLVGLAVCSVSGVVLTAEGLFGLKTSALWRQVHLISTFVTFGGLLPHLFFVAIKTLKGEASAGVRCYLWQTAIVVTVATSGMWLVGTLALSNTKYGNEFPKDYSYLFGTNRPFAPSLARTDTGGAFDARSLSGSRSCGTAGCHQQIVEEWQPSAHRYAAMDMVFQGIQTEMARQNGAESTRYCGGCHDPISLFSGTKNIFAADLTTLQGYQEGVSCLACHAIRETDIKGNASYTVTQPREYLWQWETNGPTRLVRDFLIRTYPAEHEKLAKRSFKKPEYCAACHKQFIDQEVNRVGWVQLQNQYDNWAASHWNQKGDARKTVECRECHMPLVDSRDPAAGDAMDYNRTARDGKHRSHRFIASNQLIPVAMKDRLPGWKNQVALTEKWLRGELPVPDISDKWAVGPIVTVALDAPKHVAPGEGIPLRIVMTSNKVGHDFPTGPLDIIQSWLEVTVRDDTGRTIFTSGKRDPKNFIQPGTFLFKAEPVDQQGNLIDRHNLWEMVGVRYRRALFPGYSDTVQYSVPCSGALANAPGQSKPAKTSDGKVEVPAPPVPAPEQPGRYEVTVALNYRKVDQFLLNFLFGETNTLSSPVTEIARAAATVVVKPKGAGLETAATGP